MPSADKTDPVDRTISRRQTRTTYSSSRRQTRQTEPLAVGRRQTRQPIHLAVGRQDTLCKNNIDRFIYIIL
jgi:hypothetical protein